MILKNLFIMLCLFSESDQLKLPQHYVVVPLLSHHCHCGVAFVIASSQFCCCCGVAFIVTLLQCRRHGFIIAIVVSPSCQSRFCCCHYGVAFIVALLWCHLHYCIVTVSSLPFCCRCHGIVVAILLSPSWCRFCCCIVTVSLSPRGVIVAVTLLCGHVLRLRTASHTYKEYLQTDYDTGSVQKWPRLIPG